MLLIIDVMNEYPRFNFWYHHHRFDKDWVEKLADDFQSIWDKYEQGNSRQAQETYLIEWLKLHDQYRAVFFQNCASIAHYLDENEIEQSWLATLNNKFRHDTMALNNKFIKQLRESMDKQSKSMDKTIRITKISGMISYPIQTPTTDGVMCYLFVLRCRVLF